MIKKMPHFIIACVVALAAFVVYHAIRGDDRNVALAALSVEDSGVSAINHSPARKRSIRAKLSRDVDNILDLNGNDVAQLFEAPELVRSDLPTTIWQYRNDQCVLDVYFTVGRIGDVMKSSVEHYEMRARDRRAKADFDQKTCLKDLAGSESFVSLIDVSAVYKASAQ